MLVNKRKFEEHTDSSLRHVKPFVRHDVGDNSQPLPDAVPSSSLAQLATLANLKELLDLSSLTAREDISLRFDAISEVLLNHIVLRLQAGGPDSKFSDFEILELEFYLYKSGCHEDPFTHGTEEQRESGKWYFHRAPRRNGNTETEKVRTPTAAGGYRGGTRKGLDLTFGGPVDSSVTSRFFPAGSTGTAPVQGSRRGGILLRTLRRKTDKKLFSGPSLLVDEILKTSGAHNIAELVTEFWDGNIDAFPSNSAADGQDRPSLRLHPIDDCNVQQTSTKIFRSPRIGLDLSNPVVPVPTGSIHKPTLDHPRTTFVSRRYRYFIHPSILTSNGRGHTFLGVYEDLRTDTDVSETELVRRLADLTGLKHPTAMKYLDEYRAGKKCSLRQFIGAQGKGAGSSPVPFLKMLGCLDGLQNVIPDV